MLIFKIVWENFGCKVLKTLNRKSDDTARFKLRKKGEKAS